MQLVIASHNVHKIRECRSILKPFSKLDILSLHDFPSYTPPQEEGSSFEEIATKKALHAAAALHRMVLADDSGLVVPALQGAPGIYSARYAGDTASDKENRKKLLDNMQGHSGLERQASFECHLVLATPKGIIKTAKGTAEGMITTEERGSSGFGYDSIFLKYEYSKTFAELEEEIKNRISHRRKALDKIILSLESVLCAI